MLKQQTVSHPRDLKGLVVLTSWHSGPYFVEKVTGPHYTGYGHPQRLKAGWFTLDVHEPSEGPKWYRNQINGVRIEDGRILAHGPVASEVYVLEPGDPVWGEFVTMAMEALA